MSTVAPTSERTGILSESKADRREFVVHPIRRPSAPSSSARGTALAHLHSVATYLGAGPRIQAVELVIRAAEAALGADDAFGQ